MDHAPQSRPSAAAGAGPSPRRRLMPRIPLRFLIPNLITLIGLCAGLTAIRYAIEGRYEASVIAIVVAAVLDGLDGRLARALKSTSKFGAELDSLADFLDFGVAPALLLYMWLLHQIKGFGWVAAMLFAIAAALRLARFNVMIEEDKPAWAGQFFTGMPAPAGALVGLLPVYVHLLGAPVDRAWAPFEIAYVLLIAFLMVSRIPHFSGKQIGRVPREYLLIVLFGVALTLMLIFAYPIEMLLAITLAYLAMIPFSVRRYTALARAEATNKAAHPH
jgi:CDP-diacylglycerol--serine O-phosphatidyltransferase